jgi:hypothetical protein
MGPVGAGDKTVEGHDHFENYFSIAHVGRDLPPRVNSSPSGGFGGKRSAPTREIPLKKLETRNARLSVPFEE